MTNYLIQYRRTRKPGYIPGVRPSNTFDNLTFHLDANTLSLNDDDNVSEWTELISGNSPSQATESKQPVFKTNIINGYPIVRFNAGNSEELKTNLRMVSTFPGVMSVYMVIQISSSTKGGMLTTTQSYDKEVIMGVGAGNFDGNGNNVGILYGGVGWYMDSAIGTSAVLLGFYFNVTMTTKYIFKNGVSVYSNTHNAPNTGSVAGMCIGSASGGRYFTGDVAEVMVYNEYHVDSEYSDKRNGIENYLNGKYNLW
jgi:hypothetical protein